MGNKNHMVLVLGASSNTERYSNRAVKQLLKNGYSVIPVHPRVKYIERVSVINNLSDVKVKIDTLSLQIGPERVMQLVEDIIKLNPDRVILNPGTENPELEKKLNENSIRTINACTLVLLSTDQFEKA